MPAASKRATPARRMSFAAFTAPFLVMLVDLLVRLGLGPRALEYRSYFFLLFGFILGAGVLAGTYAVISGLATGQKGAAIRGGIGVMIGGSFLVILAIALLQGGMTAPAPAGEGG